MISPLLTVMIDAAQKAAKSLLKDFARVDNIQIGRKGFANFVSEADIKTEKILQDELTKARPNFGFLMEEGGELTGKDHNNRWIIDPIDGTGNFIHGIPYFCISIGLERMNNKNDREIINGVVYDPVRDEMFYAEKGYGAFLNKNRIRVSKRKTMEEALISTSGFGLFEKKLKGEIYGLRAFGACALELAHLAAGRIDAVVHGRIKTWDSAAGSLLIKEAGGIVHNISGGEDYLYSGSVLASNGLLQEQIEKIVLGVD
jgi:myo-inositol-1(or 4)-monophosphatase